MNPDENYLVIRMMVADAVRAFLGRPDATYADMHRVLVPLLRDARSVHEVRGPDGLLVTYRWTTPWGPSGLAVVSHGVDRATGQRKLSPNGNQYLAFLMKFQPDGGT